MVLVGTLYLLVSLYIEAVRPKPLDQRKHPLFFIGFSRFSGGNAGHSSSDGAHSDVHDPLLEPDANQEGASRYSMPALPLTVDSDGYDQVLRGTATDAGVHAESQLLASMDNSSSRVSVDGDVDVAALREAPVRIRDLQVIFHGRHKTTRAVDGLNLLVRACARFDGTCDVLVAACP